MFATWYDDVLGVTVDWWWLERDALFAKFALHFHDGP